MSNITANALDWYVNQLNKWHIFPVNGATMVRDIIGKQLGDEKFTPRPLTIDNFTDAELDTIYRLAHNADGSVRNIQANTYGEFVPKKFVDKELGWYGNENRPFMEYISPLRVVSTTLGQASVKQNNGDAVLHDVYDFNPVRMEYVKNEDGSVYSPGTGKTYDNLKAMSEDVRNASKAYSSVYSRLRSNLYRLGHNEDDPESTKIHTNISMGDIEKRLGTRLGSYDVNNPGDMRKFVRNGIYLGAANGAPIGAALGTIASLMFLFSKKKRKRWVINALIHVLGGAAIGAAIGGSAGGIAANKVIGAFNKGRDFSRKGDILKTGAEKRRRLSKKEKERRKNKAMSALAWSLAYSVPALALLGGSAYAYHKGRKALNALLAQTDDSKTMKLEDVSERYSPMYESPD